MRILNGGPYCAYFKSEENKLRPEIVKDALEKRIAELKSKTTKGQTWYKRWSKIVPLSALVGYGRPVKEHLGRSYTEVAEEHNTKVIAMQQIMSSPEELGVLLRTLLPGITNCYRSNCSVEPARKRPCILIQKPASPFRFRCRCVQSYCASFQHILKRLPCHSGNWVMALWF